MSLTTLHKMHRISMLRNENDFHKNSQMKNAQESRLTRTTVERKLA